MEFYVDTKKKICRIKSTESVEIADLQYLENAYDDALDTVLRRINVKRIPYKDMQSIPTNR